MFWIAEKNHLEIENQLVEKGYRPNADFITVTHFIYPDYFYLKTEVEDLYEDLNSRGQFIQYMREMVYK